MAKYANKKLFELSEGRASRSGSRIPDTLKNKETRRRVLIMSLIIYPRSYFRRAGNLAKSMWQSCNSWDRNLVALWGFLNKRAQIAVAFIEDVLKDGGQSGRPRPRSNGRLVSRSVGRMPRMPKVQPDDRQEARTEQTWNAMHFLPLHQTWAYIVR